MRQHLEMPVPALTTPQFAVPPGVEEVVRTALAKDPASRFRHAGEFKAALVAAARQERPATTFHSRTNIGWEVPSEAPHMHADPTMRVPSPHRQSVPVSGPRSTSRLPMGLIAFLLILVGILAGAVGYLLASGRTENLTATLPATTTPPAPRPTDPPATASQPQAAVPPEPATATAALMKPPAAPAPTVAALAKPTAVPAPTVAVAVDQRRAAIERRVGDYFAALNAGDFAGAQSACCTPAWRARYPVAVWQRNFAGVSDLRFATPFRYVSVEPGRIVAEVDYSFLSGGTRPYYTLRWTFVSSGGDWLADEAVAFRQR